MAQGKRPPTDNVQDMAESASSFRDDKYVFTDRYNENGQIDEQIESERSGSDIQSNDTRIWRKAARDLQGGIQK